MAGEQTVSKKFLEMAILYFDSLPPQQTVTLAFRLQVEYSICATTFQSRVYEYYDPDVNSYGWFSAAGSERLLRLLERQTDAFHQFRETRVGTQ